MKKIKLTQGKFALVDDQDFESLNKFKWHFERYARRTTNLLGKHTNWRMHWSVIGKPLKGLEVDHINGDKLDNRRENLRVVTSRQNQCNTGKYRNNTSGYKGVHWQKRSKRWETKIKIYGYTKYLGTFLTKEEAYKVYCEANKKYHGEYGRTT